MRHIFSLQLIRQKVITGFAVFLTIIGSIGLISLYYLVKVEKKQHFVEIADDLSNYILEIRRYEKNFLLYNSPEDLRENQNYINRAMELIESRFTDFNYFKGAPLKKKLEQELKNYKKIIEEIATQVRSEGRPIDYHIEESLRESGKMIVDLSQELVVLEHNNIITIINKLKAQLLSAFTILLIAGGFLTPIVARKIVRPLRIIEKTTIRIAKGDFTPVPVEQKTKDETRSVIEAFNKMIAELEKRQDQLVQTKKLSSLGILTSGIAHQLNNPLNNISTSCQILIEEFDSGQREFLLKMLANIEQEVHRARDIVKGLLEFSREKDFRLIPTPLYQVIDRSITLISSQIPSGIEVIKDIPNDIILNLDAQRMQEVFLNLFMNAIHAITTFPGQLIIKAVLVKEKNETMITVEDTGIGISEKNLGRIFDPFFTTKEVGAGTGLGLSIAYGIIQKHNGSISAESKVGEGTKFIINLPAINNE